MRSEGERRGVGREKGGRGGKREERRGEIRGGERRERGGEE